MPDRLSRSSARERELAAALDRHWDSVLASAADLPIDDLDSSLAPTVQRVHALDVSPSLHPVFASTLWENLMHAQPPGAPALPSTSRSLAVPRQPSEFPGRWIGGRVPSSLSRLAVAIVVVALLAGSAFAALYPLRLRDGGGLLLHAPVATPSAGAVEFLWQSEGGPAPLGYPYGPGIDPDGNLWVADSYKDNFQIFAPDGTFLETWGVSGSEAGQFEFRESLYSSSADVAFDAKGNIYVADIGNYRVQKFAPDRSFLLAWGSKGTGDGQFLSPTGIAVAGDGRVYVSDESRNDVQIFDGEGTWLGTIGEQGEGEGQFRVPEGITVDMAGDLWVADFSNNRIQRFGPTGEFLDAWGRSGNADGQLNLPNDVAVDRQGRVYVADSHNHRLQVFTEDGRFLAQIGGVGSSKPGTFTYAVGVAVAENGVIFVSDANSVQAFRLILPAGDALMP
jgi:DNA-binding beta-propeller fold protein YncE